MTPDVNANCNSPSMTASDLLKIAPEEEASIMNDLNSKSCSASESDDSKRISDLLTFIRSKRSELDAYTDRILNRPPSIPAGYSANEWPARLAKFQENWDRHLIEREGEEGAAGKPIIKAEDWQDIVIPFGPEYEIWLAEQELSRLINK